MLVYLNSFEVLPKVLPGFYSLGCSFKVKPYSHHTLLVMRLYTHLLDVSSHNFLLKTGGVGLTINKEWQLIKLDAYPINKRVLAIDKLVFSGFPGSISYPLY